jgi:hypothetical protein
MGMPHHTAFVALDETSLLEPAAPIQFFSVEFYILNEPADTANLT